VGRTDSQLLDRLAREPRISAASTYTDRATAELVVGLALERGRWNDRPQDFFVLTSYPEARE